MPLAKHSRLCSDPSPACLEGRAGAPSLCRFLCSAFFFSSFFWLYNQKHVSGRKVQCLVQGEHWQLHLHMRTRDAVTACDSSQYLGPMLWALGLWRGPRCRFTKSRHRHVRGAQRAQLGPDMLGPACGIGNIWTPSDAKAKGPRHSAKQKQKPKKPRRRRDTERISSRSLDGGLYAEAFVFGGAEGAAREALKVLSPRLRGPQLQRDGRFKTPRSGAQSPKLRRQMMTDTQQRNSKPCFRFLKNLKSDRCLEVCARRRQLQPRGYCCALV